MSQKVVSYRRSPAISNAPLNALFAAAWPNWPTHNAVDFAPVLSRSLVYICAFAGEELIGFVNVAWDGGVHAFLLDTTVRPDWQRRGIGSVLVQRAVESARELGCEWLHVDYDSHLEAFYRTCGFQPTRAGLIDLTNRTSSDF